jgi:hypothetical protein
MEGAGAGLAAYAFWESVSKHPHNCAFIGLNVATVMAYAELPHHVFRAPIRSRRGLSLDRCRPCVSHLGWPYCLHYSEGLRTRLGRVFC